jgi:hypothetical protein
MCVSGEADHDSGLMTIVIPGHADHHRSEATLGCFNDQSMIGISQSFPVFLAGERGVGRGDGI